MPAWFDIPGIPGHQASSDGKILNVLKNRIIKQRPASNGAMIVGIKVGETKRTFMVHDLIANAHYGRARGYRVRHLNGDLSDNRVENLAFFGVPVEEFAAPVLSPELEQEFSRLQAERLSLVELMQC